MHALAVDPEPYVWRCSAPHPDGDYGRLEFASVYAYHTLKVLDLLDTVFFVLRRKSRQLSFLHVYHHLAIVWGTWLVVNYQPGGHFVFLGLLNAFVHSIMYAYYFAAMRWPVAVRRAVYVKQLVTISQMLQFGVLIVHSGWPLAVLATSGWSGFECETPVFLLGLCTSQNAVMLWMFGRFYARNYC